tara:strand:+ start:433 stop:600 length:168 start_codon:yes stop_codon:yes gene_type:complete
VSLLSWIKGLLKRKKKVTYIPLRTRIKDYNKKEHEEYMKLVKERPNVSWKYGKYF